ncbi:MAG: hypothetical protein GX418_10755 [Clostridiales bacterium]|nr:hypothetical protein [Clostridiales bacterium]
MSWIDPETGSLGLPAGQTIGPADSPANAAEACARAGLAMAAPAFAGAPAVVPGVPCGTGAVHLELRFARRLRAAHLYIERDGETPGPALTRAQQQDFYTRMLDGAFLAAADASGQGFAFPWGRVAFWLDDRAGVYWLTIHYGGQNHDASNA